ncbi:MAG: hypothetical protein ACRDZU_06305 [Acidimicrobiales bacterium]
MREHLKHGRCIAALVLGAALALGGCRTDRELTKPDPIPVTEEVLAAAQLTAEDLPAGFTAVDGPGTPISSEVLPEHECDDALKDLKPEESASTDFTGNGVALTDTMVWFPGQGGAVEQLFRDVAALCSSVVVADAGLAIRTNALDFGVLSDDTLAIRVEVEPDTGPITERDVVIMRQGDLLHVLRTTGPRPSDKSLLDGAVRIAIGRLGLLYADTT